MEPREGITFVNIPGEVAFNPQLNHTDSNVYWLISILDSTKDHCFATNAYLAARLNVTERTIIYSITKLKDLGYIQQVNFDGRRRTLIAPKKLLDKFRIHVEKFNSRGVQDDNRAEVKPASGQGCKSLHTDKQEYINKSGKTIILKNDSKNSVFVERDLKTSTQRNKDKKIYELPATHHKMLDLFYSIVPRNKPAEGTKSLKKDSQAIRSLITGKMFQTLPGLTNYNKGYKYTEIESVIKLHALTFNPEYEDPDKKNYNMYFHEFVYCKQRETKSYFCKWLANPPKHGGFIQKNPYPIITQELINLVNNGNGNGNPSPVEMNKFIKGSKIVVEYLKSTGKKLNPVYSSDKAKARILYNAAYSDDSITGSVKAGHLCSDIMFNQRLPHYCKEKAAIFEEEHYSPLYGKRL